MPGPRVDTIVETGCESIRFSTRDVLLGEFRCPLTYRDFRDAGRIRNHVIAFPRSSVWIHREGEPPFVADPAAAVLHTPGRAYERRPISAEGDVTDWIAVAEPVVREIVAQHSPRDAESDVAFSRGQAPVTSAVYRAQRALFTRSGDVGADRLALEESALAIVATVIAEAYSAPSFDRTVPRPHARGTRQRAGARALAEEAKALLATTLGENLSVRTLAERLGVSPFHLCRTFRAATGRTLHAHRRELRLRRALGLVAGRRGTLSMLALDLGFDSHAHLTATFRRAFGVTPSAVRGS